jgi:hypothetical protein
MDTVVRMTASDPPTWQVETGRGSLVIARIEQTPDGLFLIVPVGLPLGQINRGPYSSRAAAVGAVQRATGGSVLLVGQGDAEG